MVRLDRRQRLDCIPAQTAGLATAMRLDQGELEAAAWALGPDGTLARGAGAIAAALDVLLPGRRAPMSAAYRLRFVRGVADLAYSWVAANRHHLPGSPHIAEGVAEDVLGAAPAAEVARRILVVDRK